MPRRRFDRQERPSGPRYFCFLCRRSIDSPIQACPKHEPELHRKLSDLMKRRDKRVAAERTEGKEGGSEREDGGLVVGSAWGEVFDSDVQRGADGSIAPGEMSQTLHVLDFQGARENIVDTR